MMIALALCAVVGFQGSGPAPATNLPWGVRGELVIAAQSEPDKPLARVRFEVSSDWSRSERWFASGSLGWSLQDFTLDTMDETIGYDAPARRGHRMRTFAATGVSRSDAELSPICWLRMLKLQRDAGVTVAERRETGTVVYSFPAPGRPYYDLEIVLDTQRGNLISATSTVRGKAGDRFVHRYLDWRDFPDGSRHPWRIEIDRRLGDGRTADDVMVVQSLEPLAKGSKPTPFELPRDAVIVDYVENVQRDGRMNVTGAIPPPTTQPAARTERQATLRPWLIGGGVAMLLLAAAVWRLRARGVV